MKLKVFASNTSGKAYIPQTIEVLPDIASATIGQVATVSAVGTVAFVDPFLKNGGTVTGNLNIATGQFQINGLAALYDNGGIWGNLRVVGNMAGANNDGIYLGYNQSNAPVRLFDGGVSNYLNLSGGVLSSVGMSRFLFGTQSDDGTFAQFSGAVKIKSDLTVTGTNGTFSTASVQSNLYFLNLTRSSTALTTVGYAGFGTSNPLAPTHSFGGTAMTGGWSKTSIIQATYPVQVFNSNATKWAGIGYDFGYGMRFWVNATSEDVSGTGLNALIISNNGYVGVGVLPSYSLDVSGIANVSHLRLRTVTYPVIQDLGSDNVYMNTRVIQNVGGVYDGMYIGYGNNGSGMNRIFDGTTSNYIGIGSATFSSAGISKWLFGNQTDNGTFAQFSGAVHIKSTLTVDSTFSYGASGSRTDNSSDAGVVAYSKSGFYDSYNGTNFPTTGTWYHLINCQHYNSYAGNNYAMQIAGGFFDQRIFFRKTNTSSTQAWREFVTADMAGNVSIVGQINFAKGFNLTGNGGFYNGASKFGMDFYNGNTRFYSSGATTTTKGGFEFHNLNSDGTGDNMLLLLRNDGFVGVNQWNPVSALDVNGNINTSGYLWLSSGAFANWDGTYQRIYKRNGVAAFSIDNSNIYYDADVAHYFRGSGGASILTLATSGSYLYSYALKHLFGSQSDDGTANQFAGAIKAKSDLTVLGTSYLAATRFSSFITMPNNNFTYWGDSGGTNRRFMGLSNLNNFYIGDIDNSVSGSNNYFMANVAHYWYLNNIQKMSFNSAGLTINNSLEYQGSLKSPIRTITGGTGTYAINANDDTVIINTSPGCTFTVEAPSASNVGRSLTIVNKSIASQTLGQNYVNLSGNSTTQIPNGQSLRLKYNTTDIQQV